MRALGGAAGCAALIALAAAPSAASARGARHHAGAHGTKASAFAGASASGQSDVVHGSVVSVKVSCPRGTYKHCAAKLTLKTAGAVSVGSGKKVVTLGSGTATIGPGKAANVNVKLGSLASKALKANHGKLTVDAIVASRDGHGHGASKTSKVTIEEGGAKKEEPTSLY